jgi:hypothetical protein
MMTIKSIDRTDTAHILNLIRFLERLGVMRNLTYSATDVAPFMWDPDANGGMGEELPHNPFWIIKVERKSS